MRHTYKAVIKYQDRGADLYDAMDKLRDINANKYWIIRYQRESAMDYQIARNLMGVEDNA